MAEGIKVLVDQYSTQFAGVSQKMKDAFANAPQKVESLKQQITEMQPTVQGYIRSIQNDLQTQVIDMAPVGVEMAFHKSILEMYMWAGVSLFTSMIGHVLGSVLFGWLIGMFFSTFYAFMLALIIIPMATVHCIRKTAELSKEDRNVSVLTSTFVSAVLVGFLLSERYLSISSPPMFVLPVSIAACSVFVGPSMGSKPRSALIGASVGGAAVFYLVFGLITGSLSVTYLMWMIVLCAIAVFDYQMKLTRIYAGTASMSSDTLITVATYMAAGYVLNVLLASSSKPE